MFNKNRFEKVLTDEVEIFRNENNYDDIVCKTKYFKSVKKDDNNNVPTLSFEIDCNIIYPKLYDNLDETFLNGIISKCNYSNVWHKTMPKDYYRPNEYILTIIPVIKGLSNHLFMNNHISGANFIICNTNGYFANNLFNLATFGNDTLIYNKNKKEEHICTLCNTYKVYTDDYIDENKLLIGWKGDKPEYSGGVYKKWVHEQSIFNINNTDDFFRVLEILD